MQNQKFHAVILIFVLSTAAVNFTLVFSVLNSETSIQASGTIASILPLHVEGRYIKNALGGAVVLRGVNHGAMNNDPNGWWNPEGGGLYAGLGIWNPTAVQYNLDRMRDWGVNVVRLTTNVDWWITDNSSYRQHIKDIVTWAGDRGIYVIYTPYMIVAGSQPQLPWPPNINEATGAKIITSSQDYIDYWVSVADELKSFPNVLFEIFNEPWSNNVTAQNEFFNVTQQWIDSVRATGAKNLLVVQWWGSMGVNFWAETEEPEWIHGIEWVEQYPLNDPADNVVYSFHLYFKGIHKYYQANLTRINCYEYYDLKYGFQLAKVDYVLKNLSKPIIVGEIGVDMWKTGEELEQELAFFNNSLATFNELGISYLAWTWTTTAHMRHGLLQNGPWLPPLERNGEILLEKIT